jgi:GH24 family phage-related lysozyme (muramidase)
MDQTNIDLLRSELERDEGWRTAPYQCSTGYWTVGVGPRAPRRTEILRIGTADSADPDYAGKYWSVRRG